MDQDYFDIMDKCRKGLLKFLSETLIRIPEINLPEILDIGCGSGVSTLLLAKQSNGFIYSEDPLKLKPLSVRPINEDYKSDHLKKMKAYKKELDKSWIVPI